MVKTLTAKNIVVYGAGISGCGAAEALLTLEKTVYLYSDTAEIIEPELLAGLTKKGGGFYTGSAAFNFLLTKADLLVLSPGVDPAKPQVKTAEARGLAVISEIELAYRLYPGHLAAITGTNGKTTTTTLIGEFFKRLAVPSVTSGNIGSSLTRDAFLQPAEAWIAAEVSSFQLEKTATFAPDIAVVLNLTPDHLERHKTLAAYAAAKENILLKQRPEQVAILNYDDSTVRAWAKLTRAQICYFSRRGRLAEGAYLAGGNFFLSWRGLTKTICPVASCRLFGGHNEENMLAAIACGFFAGVSAEAMAEVLRAFRGVEHRLEYVATKRGVPYYNDSKATNTDAAVKALEAFSAGRIILIAGGHDKLTDLGPLMQLVRQKTDALILLGEAKQRFQEAAQAAGITQLYLAADYAEAVKLASSIARPPQTVLLAPACSSFDMFSGYEERGRYFKKLVLALPD